MMGAKPCRLSRPACFRRAASLLAGARLFFLLAAAGPVGHAAEPVGNDSARVIPLSGADWRIREAGAVPSPPAANLNGVGWIPATVPGNIQADLEAAHLLEPLWYGAGDPRLHEVARKNWWYRKDFAVPSSWAGQRLTLVFDGVDHECEIWLNGRRIGANVGMFRRFWFDVTGTGCPARSNHLAVRIAKIPDVIAPLVSQTDGQGVVNDGTHFLARQRATPKVLKELKSPTNWGWDWGVNIWTLGIWKDLRLQATGPARIDWTRVRTALSDDHARATVTASLEIESLSDLPAKAQFSIAGQGQTAQVTVDAELRKGRNLVKAEMALDQPVLWWPNGQGDQPLYTLRAVLPTR